MTSMISIKGGIKDYILNDKKTMTKLKTAAKKIDLEIIHNPNGSKTILCSTGAYINVVWPLVRVWKGLEGDYINREMVDGMEIRVVNVEHFTDTNGTIVHYIVKLCVDGHDVTVTCFDTKLTVTVQGSASTVEMYVTRALQPHLEDEVRINKKTIEEANKTILHHNESKPTTRRQHQQMLREPGVPAPCTPRQRTLSSPGSLLCTLDEEVQLTEGRVLEKDSELGPFRAGRLMLEDASLPASDASVELLAIEYVTEDATRQEAVLQEASLSSRPNRMDKSHF